MFQPEDDGSTAFTPVSGTIEVGYGIIMIDAGTGKPGVNTLLNIINDETCAYKGRVVYVSNLSSEVPWPDPFLFPNKFYFNEDCQWFESPFSFNGIL